MPTDAPRRGRPPAVIDLATLPPLARVLRPHLDTTERRQATGVPNAILSDLINGRTADPRVSTLAAVLAAIRPEDKDGGWGWFGRMMVKEADSGSRRPSAPTPRTP
jgi:hypothetical protein